MEAGVKRRLYHGSKAGIAGMIRPDSRTTCDFGRAFYMGECEQQPGVYFDELCERYRSGEGIC